MPIYEYECRKCKAHVEILQKITDKPLAKCRKCGGKLEKQWSATSFQLKGTGWYATDYAAKKTGAVEEKKSGAAEPATTTTTAANAAAPATEKSQSTETPAPKKTRTNNAASSKNSSGD
jgi:putative FmdB family regulatory protein